MSQSLARIWLHIVFSTNERRAYLQNADLREEMFRMLGYHAGEAGCTLCAPADGLTTYMCCAGWLAP